MVHRGVGGDADAENARDGDARRFAHRRDQRQKRLFEDRVLQALDAAGLRLLDDAVDDVRAVADLAVAGRGLGRERAGGKVHENAGDGRGADVDGAAVERRVGFSETSMTVSTPSVSVPETRTLKFASRSVLASFLTVW